MSSKWNNHGLPFLPGNTFRDVTKSAFHLPQTLVYKNGYALPRRPSVGIGQEALFSEMLSQQEIDKLSLELADITYGSHDQKMCEDFIPAYVALDKKLLRFFAYFTEDVLYSPEEEYRVRPVVIYYYLKDDSVCIVEPTVKNSGLIQGKRLKRQRLTKNERGDLYLWKDLNLGIDLEVHGFKYHIIGCDDFTKEFMESEGIVLNDPEPMPEDPYIKRRHAPQPSHTTPSTFNKTYNFFTMDGQVLRFYAVWDDTDSPFGDTRHVIIHYYLVDDTVEIREVHERNSGRDTFPIIMRRLSVPKKLKTGTFPSCSMEISKDNVEEYYSPKDFQLGQTVTLLSRRFLLYDCDRFTKEYYQQNYPEMELKPIELPKKTETLTEKKKEFPPYNGFGSLEDSLQNCLSLVPQPPKVNVLKMLENDHKVLHFSVRLVSPHPEDEDRRFTLSYFLSDDTISIFEKPTRNTGVIGGKFLKKTRIRKPGTTGENPEFYSPADLAIGNTIEVFSHRFVITDADLYVLKYLESISSQIPSHTLDSLRQKLGMGTMGNQPADLPVNGEKTENHLHE